MTQYDAVVNTLIEENLAWDDVAQIRLNDETFDEFLNRASFSPSDYKTTNKPAVRRTNDEEKIVYVNEDGDAVEVAI